MRVEVIPRESLAGLVLDILCHGSMDLGSSELIILRLVGQELGSLGLVVQVLGRLGLVDHELVGLGLVQQNLGGLGLSNKGLIRHGLGGLTSILLSQVDGGGGGERVP